MGREPREEHVYRECLSVEIEDAYNIGCCIVKPGRPKDNTYYKDCTTSFSILVLYMMMKRVRMSTYYIDYAHPLKFDPSILDM